MKIAPFLVLALSLVTSLALADAPVVELGGSNSNAAAATSPQASNDAPEAMMPNAKTKPIASEQPIAANSQQNQNAAPLATTAPPDDVSNINTANLTTNQRLARLEQQINNLVQMNLPARINSLQQDVEKMNGQNDKQTHDIQALNDQLRNFYADLQRRIADVKGGVAAPSAPATPTGFGPDHNGSSIESQGSTLQSASSALASPDQDQQSIPKEQKIYEDAFADLQQKKYESASTKFVSYIKSYPKGAYAVNAHYWLGECYYLINQFDKAGAEFKIVLGKYPNSTKTADSLLKLGIIHNSMGKYAEARKELQQVQSRFPGSTAAQLATHQLASMTADATSEANKKKQKQLIE